jgi:hypothetical protein
MSSHEVLTGILAQAAGGRALFVQRAHTHGRTFWQNLEGGDFFLFCSLFCSYHGPAGASVQEPTVLPNKKT